MRVPAIPRKNIIIAAPEPLPLPKRVVKSPPEAEAAIRGSQNLSTNSPPKKNPMGMVKNCRVFRQDYTRPCISAGMVERRITSRLAFIIGTGIQPMICPRHHQMGEPVKASRKFSVLRENSIVR